MKWIGCMSTYIPTLLDLPPTPPQSHPWRSPQSTELRVFFKKKFTEEVPCKLFSYRMGRIHYIEKIWFPPRSWRRSKGREPAELSWSGTSNKAGGRRDEWTGRMRDPIKRWTVGQRASQDTAVFSQPQQWPASAVSPSIFLANRELCP